MSNPIVAFLIPQVVNLILGSGVLERVAGVVQRWAEKEIAGHEKMTGVLNELEVIGLHLAAMRNEILARRLRTMRGMAASGEGHAH